MLKTAICTFRKIKKKSNCVQMSKSPYLPIIRLLFAAHLSFLQSSVKKAQYQANLFLI